MEDFSILIGGKAGEGIDSSSTIIASIFNRLGYFIYVYRDYPSVIRGGHTFSIIRISTKKIKSHLNKIDFLLALNQDAIDFHKDKLKKDAFIIYNSSLVKSGGTPIDLTKIINEEKAKDYMKNSIIMGAFFKILNIDFNLIEETFKEKFHKDADLNINLAKRGYGSIQNDKSIKNITIKKTSSTPKPLLSGNEAIGLGLVNGGLDAYVAYPMTPTSNILHFLASLDENFNLKVIHPESEISVMIMALGFGSQGYKTAVGTSGGGFCLMTEGLSFSAMAEIPIVVVMGQRGAPATGLPTYTAQSDLNFVMSAGHGDFLRIVIAPSDIEDAFYLSTLALNLSWKYQIPAIILTDKILCEGLFSFDTNTLDSIRAEKIRLSSKNKDYKRYLNTENGVSELSFYPLKDNVIKINSYEHDEKGITTEDAKITKDMQEKRFKKLKFLEKDLENIETIKIYGNSSSSTALICFGSNKCVCEETALKFNIMVIQIVFFSPFPEKKLKDALKNVKKILTIENNITHQMASIISSYGINIDEKILKYDGRPFSVDELENILSKVTR